MSKWAGNTNNRYLADIDRQAEELFSRLVKQMAEQEGVTEELKTHDQMAWVGKVNNNTKSGSGDSK